MGRALRREAKAEGWMKFPDTRRDHMYHGAVLGEPAMGTQNLNLLHAIGAADGDAFSVEQAWFDGGSNRKL